MVKDFKKVSDEIRWKLALLKGDKVSLRLKKRAISDISDYLEDYYEHSYSVNMYLLCSIDQIGKTKFADFIKGFWKSMEEDQHYEMLYHLKKFLSSQ